MFGFLKDKLKSALGKFTKGVEKEATIEHKEVKIENKPDTKKFEDKPTINKSMEKKLKIDEEPKKKGFFSRIFGRKEEEDIIQEKEDLLEELESKDLRAEELTIIEKENIKEIVKPIEKTIKKEPIIVSNVKVEHAIEENKLRKDDITIKEKDIHMRREQKNVVREEKPIKINQESVTIPEDYHHEKKGFFSRITETFTKFHLSEEKFEELFWDLEFAMLENNVAVEVIDKIKSDLKSELMKGRIYRKGVEELITDTLRKSIVELFDIEKIDLLKMIREKKKKPYIIAIIGVNGSGKTTSIAKLTHMIQKNGLSVVLAASDTFRAAAIQQLEEHANKLNTKLIKHDYHSDPAAVAFDAIKYAEAHTIDVVIIDTAGRLHSNTNLMNELTKVVRVCKPDIKIFVGESITGNDCIEQAKEFDKAVGIDAIILAKADVDEKGGAAISVTYVLQRPILYLGTGQSYDDLKEFDPKLIIESLEL